MLGLGACIVGQAWELKALGCAAMFRRGPGGGNKQL